MKQTVEVNGKIRTGFSPKDKGDGLSIPKIDREFDRQAEELITKRKAANASLGKTSSLLSVAKAVKNRLTPFISGTFTRQDRNYLPPDYFPSTPPRVSPNSPTRGGYKTRKYKKPTIIAKKPKKATILAKKPKKPTILPKKPKKVNKVKKLIKNKAKV
jgi:hypothetical protein